MFKRLWFLAILAFLPETGYCDAGGVVNPVIEPKSAIFSHNNTYVFSPSEPKFECDDALAFRFKQGPVVGLCADSLRTLSSSASWRVGERGDRFAIGVKNADGTIRQLMEGGGSAS